MFGTHVFPVVVMAPPRKRTLPKPLPDGFILTDTEKKKWRLGKILGQGGFGLIYLGNEHNMSDDTHTHAHTHTVTHQQAPYF